MGTLFLCWLDTIFWRTEDRITNALVLFLTIALVALPIFLAIAIALAAFALTLFLAIALFVGVAITLVGVALIKKIKNKLKKNN
jgi:hypothetical protein